MRTPPAAILLAVCLLLPAARAQAAAPSPPATLLTDATGDVSGSAAGQATPAQPAAAWSAVDLVALAVSEDPDAFTFNVTLAGLGGDQPRQDYGAVEVLFSYGGSEFDVHLYRSADNAAYFGSLYDDGHYARSLPAMRDLGASHLATVVDRSDLVAKDGRTPGRGETLDGIHVRSTAAAANTVSTGNDPATWIGDLMPDDGPGPSWTVLYHGHDGKGAALASDHPFRSSNGEATTHQFDVKASAEAAGRYRLSAEGIPPGWDVRLPGTLVDLPAGQPVAFTVLATVPFAHVHGSTASFTLRLAQEGGDGWATLELGVHYTTVPQPAGHHSDLYLHSIQWSAAAQAVNPPLGGSTGELFMNTLQDDGGDYGVPVEGWASITAGKAAYHWVACLSPALALGLDFDLHATGSVKAPVKTTRPLAGAALEGRLVRLGPGAPMDSCSRGAWGDRKATTVATIASDSPKDLAANGEATLDAVVRPTPAGDYVPYEDGAALVLELNVTADGPGIGGAGGVELQPGTWLNLPLLEYHDAVAVISGGNGTGMAPGFVAEPAPAKKSPGPTPIVAAGALALVALARRRRA